MIARLVPVDDGPSITIDRPIIFIGRDQDCDICIDSRKISRRHCCVAQVDDCLIIRDLGSTNGLLHNGKKVREAQLRPEDEVLIGNLCYQLVLDEAESRPSKPPAGSDEDLPL